MRDVSEEPVPLLGGHLAQTSSEEEKWLFVGEASGRVLDRFDASFVPSGFLPIPGPRRAVSGSPVSLPGASMAQLQSGTVIWQFLYFDSEVSQYRPILLAQWSVEYREGWTGPVTGTDQGTTDLNGLAVISCRPNERYFGLTQTWGSIVRTLPLATVGWNGQFNLDCGLTRQAVVTGNASRVYAIMTRAGYDANTQFGLGRPQVLAELKSDDGSFYSLNQDKIVLRESSLGGEFGRFVIGHEYGHAYHNRAMGGVNPNFADNCNPHSLNIPSSYGCALSEGFADFFSAFLTGNLRSSFEANIYHSSGVPSPMTEGPVASALLDIVDPANEGHDGAQWVGSYLPRLVGTCEWSGFFGTFARASGIDHVTYCLEQAIESFATNLYAGRVVPTGWRHSAVVPGTWSKAVARPLWYTNIFQ
jgi:hypothetical protein